MLTKFFRNKHTRDACHIFTMLKSAAKKRHFSFHTPGHKYSKWDLTELSFSDNLSCPTGCIQNAQTDTAKILQANACFFLTDGSTSGVFSMLFAAKTLGSKKVLIPAQAHKSVENACAVFGLGVTRFFEFEQIPAMLVDADALLITSPSYYGRIPDLSALQTACREQNKLFLIDGAHGGHLHFDQALYAGTYADMWVDGVHKSLPALTQGALVCAKTEREAKALENAVDIFRTTSPSYPILASVEYAVKYPQNARLEHTVRKFAKQTDRVDIFDDWTKLCVRIGSNAFTAQKALEEDGFYPEFCDGENIVFYLSPATKNYAFFRLQRRLKRLLADFPETPVQRIPVPAFSQQEGETEWINLDECTHRICAENCGLFPPCTPLVLRGQRVEKEHIDLFKNAPCVYGLHDGKMCVFKKIN